MLCRLYPSRQESVYLSVETSSRESYSSISNNDQQATLIEQQQTSSLQQIISQSLTADAVDWDIAPTPPSIFYNKDKPAQALITQDKTVNPVITTPVLSDEVMWTPAKSSVSITVAPEVSSQIGFLVSQISLPNTETGVNTVQDQVAKRIVNAIVSSRESSLGVQTASATTTDAVSITALMSPKPVVSLDGIDPPSLDILPSTIRCSIRSDQVRQARFQNELRKVQYMADHFWHRWRLKYINAMQPAALAIFVVKPVVRPHKNGKCLL